MERGPRLDRKGLGIGIREPVPENTRHWPNTRPLYNFTDEATNLSRYQLVPLARQGREKAMPFSPVMSVPCFGDNEGENESVGSLFGNSVVGNFLNNSPGRTRDGNDPFPRVLLTRVLPIFLPPFTGNFITRSTLSLDKI